MHIIAVKGFILNYYMLFGSFHWGRNYGQVLFAIRIVLKNLGQQYLIHVLTTNSNYDLPISAWMSQSNCKSWNLKEIHDLTPKFSFWVSHWCEQQHHSSNHIIRKWKILVKTLMLSSLPGVSHHQVCWVCNLTDFSTHYLHILIGQTYYLLMKQGWAFWKLPSTPISLQARF